ncbi:MAG: sel1 repeat family protein [Deltaproteobacteria bacterium]|nr:sel1 repeat family protein [Deltaproteobacteria bacterium]
MSFVAISHQLSAASRNCHRPDTDVAEELFQLGLAHLNADALPTAGPLGVACLKRAAALGHAGAHFELGEAYRFGREVDEDMDTAWAYYLFAATHGHAEAAMTLGVLYETGRGLPQSLVLAHAFYSLARDNGDPRAADLLTELEQYMTAEEIAEAREFSRRRQLQGLFAFPKRHL